MRRGMSARIMITSPSSIKAVPKRVSILRPGPVPVNARELDVAGTTPLVVVGATVVVVAAAVVVVVGATVVVAAAVVVVVGATAVVTAAVVVRASIRV